MTDNAHPLDRPAWHALTGRQADKAIGDACAWRMAPEFGPFAAAADDGVESQAALAALTQHGPIWVVEAGDIVPPPGVVVTKEALCHQMVMQAPTPAAPPTFDWEPLGEADADQMLALATLTEPGPFAIDTHRLVHFIGVKQGGQLIAMAGERMQPCSTPPHRYTEVSGVCTHPDHRGRGYANGLMRIVIQGILDRGETPFLHSYADNAGAIALYESLGFAFRSAINVRVMAAL